MLKSKDISIKFLSNKITHGKRNLDNFLFEYIFCAYKNSIKGDIIGKLIENNRNQLFNFHEQLYKGIIKEIDYYLRFRKIKITNITITYENIKVKRLKLNDNNIKVLAAFLIALLFNSWKIYLKLNCPYDTKINKILLDKLLDNNSGELIYRYTYNGTPYFNNIFYF